MTIITTLGHTASFTLVTITCCAPLKVKSLELDVLERIIRQLPKFCGEPIVLNMSGGYPGWVFFSGLPSDSQLHWWLGRYMAGDL